MSSVFCIFTLYSIYKFSVLSTFLILPGFSHQVFIQLSYLDTDMLLFVSGALCNLSYTIVDFLELLLK